MKKILFPFAILFVAQLINAQVPKKVVVEHFTNTKCSVCASGNPGFYTNLNSQTGVIHLAIHPSSPYASCLLSMQNQPDNNARTNYYGVFGSTPVLVIQGSVISGGTDYSLPSMFTPFLGQTSPAMIKIRQAKFGNDSIRSTIVVKTVATHTLSNLSLFVALAEDTVFYTGTNGEPKHFDVFRKAYTGASGISITLPPTVGDSVVYTKSSPANVVWNFSRIYTMAILQNAATKEVVQSESIPANLNNLTTGIFNTTTLNESASVYVIDNNIIVKQEKITDNNVITIYDVTGRVLLNKVITNNLETIVNPSLSTGVYVYAIKSKDAIIKTGKLFIQ